MDLVFHNSLTRRREVFKPLGSTVGIYSCGPTVYDFAHIGNWRSFLTADLLRRVLEYNDHQTKTVMNVTDVDDKTIAGSRAAGETLAAFTQKYEAAFLADRARLNILPPTKLTRATEYLPQMIKLVEELLAKNFAYSTTDGIYFSVAKLPSYGRFRTVTPSAEADFALWKFWQPADGEVGWKAPFGPPGSQTSRGRPGWHLECSAMSAAELGEQFDFHTGGADLIFPHHENELAQSEAASGKAPLARFWLHNEFVLVDGQKMSKSLGNIYTLNDLAAKKISPLAYRYWLLTAHYRTPVNFTWEAAAGAETALRKLHTRVRQLRAETEKEGGEKAEVDDNYRQKFLTAVNDDLNLPVALALVWKLLADLNLPPPVAHATILDFDRVFGLNLLDVRRPTITAEISSLVAKRELARTEKNWAEADRLRREIETAGWQVNDTASGPEILPL